MEHEQRACPRCRKPAGDYHFCPSCLAPIDSLTGSRERPEAYARERGAQPPREVLRLEQASASTANGDGDRVAGDASTTAVQVKEGRPAEGVDATAGARDVAQLPSADPNRIGGLAQAPREVARLEDVLTVVSEDAGEQARPTSPSEPAPAPRHVLTPLEVLRLEGVSTPPPASAERITPRTAAAAPEAVPAAAAPEAEPTAAAPEAEPTAAGPEAVPAERRADGARAETSVAPPAAVPTPSPSPADVEVPAGSREPASTPAYVDAHALREAFWFEQASALSSRSEAVATPANAPQAAVPEVEPDQHLADSSVEAAASEAAGQALAQDDDPASLVQLWLDQTSRNGWLAAICLLALVALAVALMGRDPRRLLRGRTS